MTTGGLHRTLSLSNPSSSSSCRRAVLIGVRCPIAFPVHHHSRRKEQTPRRPRRETMKRFNDAAELANFPDRTEIRRKGGISEMNE